jgi:hypothetical protein
MNLRDAVKMEIFWTRYVEYTFFVLDLVNSVGICTPLTVVNPGGSYFGARYINQI